MSQPIYFLTVAEVIAIHDELLEKYGGDSGMIGDGELLLSALSAPEAGVAGGYLHTSLFEMAAAYMYHIILDHPFIDANKRTGSFAALLFLESNGIFLNGADEMRDLALAVQRKLVTKSELAIRLSKLTT